jgi:isopentenyl phosphate kinase
MDIQFHLTRLYLLDVHREPCYIFSMLVFLKLGGSLITDKDRPYTPRLDLLNDLARQIFSSLQDNPDLQILLGHGSGSFGHQPASKFGTRNGVSGQKGWHGFAEVWHQASLLNRLVVDALSSAGLPVITISPSSAVRTRDRKVVLWDLSPIKTSLERSLLPVIYGDVVFDGVLGGTILSTEELFAHLAPSIHPDRILLAGSEAGVWEDFPARNRLIPDMTPSVLSKYSSALGKSSGTDVTGGMLTKITSMLALVEQMQGLEILIFSGQEPGNLQLALQGENPGTLLHR